MENTVYGDQVQSQSYGIFTAQVFGWMTLGVVSTAIVAFIIGFFGMQSDNFLMLVSVLFLPAIIIQLILVLVLSLLWRKLNGAVAAVLFIAYSLFTGVTVGIIGINYSVSSLFFAFGISAVMFFILAAYGLITKKDLSRWGAVALFALVGIILVSIFNFVLLLLNSPLFSPLNAIINYAIVIVFSILIASDANKLKSLANEAERSGQGYTRYAVLGALTLYLDFINLFLSVLRITGNRR